MATTDQTAEVVRRVVVEQLGGDARIVSVDLEDDVDCDGDPILLVRVVYEAASGRLNASRASGLIRHLRPALETVSETRFPLLSFISKEDMEKSSAAA